jgi:ABC-type cobalt transport system substrate-binding protein
MRKKLLVVLAVVVAALLLATNPVVAKAGNLITGADIKDNSVKGADVKESSLAAVPWANGLTPLPSGQTESGAFSAAGANSSGSGGWLGFDINYPRPLATPIDEGKIIDTDINPDATNCPGPGQAAPGYLCLYFYDHSGTGAAYGYSSSGPYAQLDDSVGVGLYVPVTGAQPYVDGVWTVTAP